MADKSRLIGGPAALRRQQLHSEKAKTAETDCDPSEDAPSGANPSSSSRAFGPATGSDVARTQEPTT